MNKDTMIGYTYFYRVTIEKNNKLQYLVLKFKSAMTLEGVQNFLLLVGVINEQDLNGELMKWDAITHAEYLSARKVATYVITSKTVVYQTLYESDVCDCLFIIADAIPVIADKERIEASILKSDWSNQRKIKLSIASLAEQVIVTINV